MRFLSVLSFLMSILYGNREKRWLDFMTSVFHIKENVGCEILEDLTCILNGITKKLTNIF